MGQTSISCRFGVSSRAIKSIKVPTVVIPGNDRTHGTETGRIAAKLIPKSELHIIWEKDLDVDLGAMEDWEPKNPEMAGYFIDMMKRVEAQRKA